MPRLGSLALVLAACSAPAPTRQPPAPAPAAVGPAAVEDSATEPARPPISEAHARAVLERLFRGRGLRILRDVEVTINGTPLTVDGYDPQRRLGFEYTDPAERAVQPENRGLAQRRAGEPRVLLLAPGDESTITEKAQRFLDIERPAAAQPR